MNILPARKTLTTALKQQQQQHENDTKEEKARRPYSSSSAHSRNEKFVKAGSRLLKRFWAGEGLTNEDEAFLSQEWNSVCDEFEITLPRWLALAEALIATGVVLWSTWERAKLAITRKRQELEERNANSKKA